MAQNAISVNPKIQLGGMPQTPLAWAAYGTKLPSANMHLP